MIKDKSKAAKKVICEYECMSDWGQPTSDRRHENRLVNVKRDEVKEKINFKRKRSKSLKLVRNAYVQANSE